jgi:dihydrofolate reductase
MKVSIIVAMAANRVIGRDGDLPWKLPADLKRFKRLTMGHHLIVGRKTWESIGRPLPGRHMVVVTRRDDYAPEGVQVAGSVEAAIEVARAAGDDEAFIGGGAAIYREALERADRLYVTRIHEAVAGDTLFPEVDESAWESVEHEIFPADEKNRYATSFTIYRQSKRPGVTPGPCLGR